MSFLASSVIQIAEQEVGYKEVPNNKTKYWDYFGWGNGQAWCQAFVNWCFEQAYGKEGANKLLCGGNRDFSTISQKNKFNSAARLVDFSSIQPGDIVWRSRSGGGHVGLVVAVSGSTFTTIEGNTGGTGADADWNGEGVHKKPGQTSSNWNWCGRPYYDGQGDLSSITYTGGAATESSNGTLLDSVGNVISTIQQGAETAWNALTSAAKATINKISDWIGDVASIFNKASLSLTTQEFTINYQEVTEEIIKDEIKTVDANDLGNGGYTNLLSNSSLVECPFILLKVGDVTFGKYTSEGGISYQSADYPNYIDSMNITKISGQVNQYSINLIYQITPGDDPNLLDKIFSSVGYGKVYVSYGDYNSPTFVYKEEEAILTKITSSVDFTGSSISYTVECTSTASLLASTAFDFEAVTMKPSLRIKEILSSSKYGLQEVFTGMTNMTAVANNNLIPTDDQSVEIEAKTATDALTYLQYLVTCMSASTNGIDDPLKDSTYHMTIYDDGDSSKGLNGCYFKITKVSSSAKTLASTNTFDLDIGYPTDNQVMSFSVNTDNSWSLIYSYSDSINQPKYTYKVNKDGHLEAQYSPNLLTSTSYNKMTETQKTWWTNMTQFPIEASVTLKGLVRPAVLMTYIRVNAMFYGQRHVSSGLYIITGQQDQIDSSGFRTTLALTRIAGDSDYIQKTKTTVTSKIPVSVDVVTKKIDVALTTKSSAVSSTSSSSSTTSSSTTSSESYSNANQYAGTTVTHGALSGNTVGGTYTQGTSYSVSDTDCIKIAAAMATEQGSWSDDNSSLTALKWETSLMMNQMDKFKKSGVMLSDATIAEYIHQYYRKYPKSNKTGTTWRNIGTYFFAPAAPAAYDACPGVVGQSFAWQAYNSSGNRGRSGNNTVTQGMANAVKDVVVYGHRYTDADEQGCDYGYLKCGTYEIGVDGGTPNKSAVKASKGNQYWIPNVTKLRAYLNSGWGQKSTFVGFPANNTKYDAFSKVGW